VLGYLSIHIPLQQDKNPASSLMPWKLVTSYSNRSIIQIPNCTPITQNIIPHQKQSGKGKETKQNQQNNAINFSIAFRYSYLSLK
jgi:hypothetical protein